MSSAWGDAWGALWGDSWGSMPGGGGACDRPWRQAWADSWGDSWGTCDGDVTPPTPTPTPTPPPDAGGVGRQSFPDAWLKKKPRKAKRRKSLLEELDDMIAELRSRERLEPEAVRAAVPDFNILLADARMAADVSDQNLRAQITRVKAILDEMDDEEAILLALH